MLEDELHATAGQRAHAGTLAPSAQRLEVDLQVAQVPIDAQRAPRLAGKGMEVLVARERPGLLVEALDQPVEELAHAINLPRAPTPGRENSVHCAGGGLQQRVAARAAAEAVAAGQLDDQPPLAVRRPQLREVGVVLLLQAPAQPGPAADVDRVLALDDGDGLCLPRDADLRDAGKRSDSGF